MSTINIRAVLSLHIPLLGVRTEKPDFQDLVVRHCDHRYVLTSADEKNRTFHCDITETMAKFLQAEKYATIKEEKISKLLIPQKYFLRRDSDGNYVLCIRVTGYSMQPFLKISPKAFDDNDELLAAFIIFADSDDTIDGDYW